MIDPARLTKDTSWIAVLGSSPWWTDWLQPFFSFIALATAAAYGVVRLLIVWREYREGGKGSSK